MNVNGKIIEAHRPVIKVNDHSYRYGHGLFETMKVCDDKILLEHLHFERLFKGLEILKLNAPDFFTTQNLSDQIIRLYKKNNFGKLARVRLSVSAGQGGLYDNDGKFQFIIECWPLSKTNSWLNENGLVIDIFPDAKKSCDIFSNLKSASHLIYAMAAKFAKENKLNDVLLFNAHNRICDSSIANLFWIKEKKIFTPPLSEGCIAGVMRKYLLERLITSYPVAEKQCEINDLENADEVFLTNAIQGIKWVKQFRNKIYSNTIITDIYSS